MGQRGTMVLRQLNDTLQCLNFCEDELRKFKENWEEDATEKLVAIMWMNNLSGVSMQIKTRRGDVTKKIENILNTKAKENPQLAYATLGFIIQQTKRT